MQVAVLGSCHPDEHSWQIKHPDKFKEACNEIGIALAKAEYALVVAEEAERTADLYVHQGFIQAGGSRDHVFIVKEKNRFPPSSLGAAHITAVARAEAVIMLGGREGSFNAGLTALMEKKKLIPIGCFGGAAEELLRHVDSTPGALSELRRIDPSRDKDWAKRISTITISLLQTYPQILIVHGRHLHRETVEKILLEAQSEFPHLPSPIIMKDNGTGAIVLAEQFEALANRVDAAIIVVTPDDIGASALDEQGRPLYALELDPFKPRSRENVWLELGFLWARLGRRRLLVLRNSEVSVPSDLGGILHLVYKNDPSDVAQGIFKFIRDLRGPAQN